MLLAPSVSRGEPGLSDRNTFKIKKNQAIPLLRDPTEVTRTQTLVTVLLTRRQTGSGRNVTGRARKSTSSRDEDAAYGC